MSAETVVLVLTSSILVVVIAGLVVGAVSYWILHVRTKPFVAMIADAKRLSLDVHEIARTLAGMVSEADRLAVEVHGILTALEAYVIDVESQTRASRHAVRDIAAALKMETVVNSLDLEPLPATQERLLPIVE